MPSPLPTNQAKATWLVFGRPAPRENQSTRTRLTLRPEGLCLGVLVVTMLFLSGCSGQSRRIQLKTHDGVTAWPLEAVERTKATVFLFTRTDCPISNRSAPEVNRIQAEFAPRGVVFWLVYPNPDVTAEAIQQHLEDYGYEFGALRDPGHELVTEFGASVTPEAAVITPEGTLAYRGRINDRHVDFGKAQREARRHDLKSALNAVLSGRPADPARTPAVGCYISDLR